MRIADDRVPLLQVLQNSEYLRADPQRVVLHPLFGEDRFGHFRNVPTPDGDLTREALASHHRILAAQNEDIYAGAEQGRA